MAHNGSCTKLNPFKLMKKKNNLKKNGFRCWMTEAETTNTYKKKHQRKLCSLSYPSANIYIFICNTIDIDFISHSLI